MSWQKTYILSENQRLLLTPNMMSPQWAPCPPTADIADRSWCNFLSVSHGCSPSLPLYNNGYFICLFVISSVSAWWCLERRNPQEDAESHNFCGLSGVPHCPTSPHLVLTDLSTIIAEFFLAGSSWIYPRWVNTQISSFPAGINSP